MAGSGGSARGLLVNLLRVDNAAAAGVDGDRVVNRHAGGGPLEDAQQQHEGRRPHRTHRRAGRVGRQSVAGAEKWI